MKYEQFYATGTLPHVTKHRLISEIEYDIERGIYDQYEKSRSRLNRIVEKMKESMYVINSSKEPTRSEIRFIEEMGYVI